MNKKNIIMLSLLAGTCLQVGAQTDSVNAVKDFVDQEITVGLDKDFTRETSTQAVSVITNKTIDKRSAKNIGNSIIGQGNGLISLDGSGTGFTANPTFYIRGLQTLNYNNGPLFLVDGVERDITLISPEEVDNVQILKDAAAVAIYGYKGINGVVQINTKRGKYNSKKIQFTYDHVINYQIDRPQFVNGYDYANAMNYALQSDGLAPKYDAQALAAFKNGTYPYQYPNVNWVDQTFRNHGILNKYNLEFSGGGQKFRYFTALNLISDKGYIKNPEMTEGYSTQDKYVKGNLRVNLDIDLTPKTMLKVNMLGMLSEVSQPGEQVDLWSLVYNTPSAAFPIKNETGTWGGNSIWSGNNNTVAQSTGAAYYKRHQRALYADMTLKQDLSAITQGLGGTVRVGYDTYATLYEDHSTYDSTTGTSYLFGMYTPVLGSWNADGSPVLNEYYSGGKRTEMGSGSGNYQYARRLVMDASINYDRTFGDHSVYSQIKYAYEYQNTTGTNTTIYRHDINWFGRYAYKQRYIADLSLSYMCSSRLAKGSKWNTGTCGFPLSPTLSLAWVASKEDFLKDVKWINFLKLRTSIGQLNADYLPGETWNNDATGTWTYDSQSYYTPASGYYLVDATAAQEIIGNVTTLGSYATENSTHEKAVKYNIGIDASLFNGLNIELDYYFQHRYDIFVSSAYKYSSLIGFGAPYENSGAVNSHGFEASLDYTKQIGKVTINVGGTFNVNKNTILLMGEEPKAYSNLVTTGNPLQSTWGYVDMGLFQQSDDKDGDGYITSADGFPAQNLGSTPRVGDIRYKDINGDGVIDTNDKTKIGDNADCPNIYYSLHLGAEWKGLGFYAMFQGVGQYTAYLNTSGYYWGLINNTNLSQYVYEHSWTETNPDAEFPRLSSSSNANNYQTSTFWMRDRSYFKLRNIEVYYNFPKSLLSHLKVVNAFKVYVRGTDLFTLDHLETVDAGSYGTIQPLNRSLIFGASITF